MSRSLTILFRRDPSRDRQLDNVRFEGYQPFWPDGRPVTVGLDAFCMHGQRLLGLGKHLAGRTERLLKVLCLPLSSREDDLNRIPGYRVRRFCLERRGNAGQVFFLDGTPTTIFFELERDEDEVLDWIGLPGLGDGERMWFDLAAMPVEKDAGSVPRPRLATADV